MSEPSQPNPFRSSSDIPLEQPNRPVSATNAYDPDSLTAQLVNVLDQYMADLESGCAPSREKLLADHPQLASQLDACLAGVEFIHGAGGTGHGTPKELGDFLIRREIGRGGMGAVYEAQQISLGRKVALKVLQFGSVADVEAVHRFQREAETVASLHHTNIVPIYSVGSEAGVNYYAMQFIEGRSLDRVTSEAKGPLEPATVANWGLQAADALAHAHQRDVIHRDVKPSNLILDDDGRIWLTDFGLAKRLDDVTLSITGALLGTPRYMSPEQAEAAIRAVDHRTDIYSLGATLYELVTGQPVFAADTPHGVITQILNTDPLPPRQHQPHLSRDFETVLLKCLSKEASQRYGTAQELAEDLRAIVEDRPIRAQRPHVVQRARRWIKKNKRTVAPIATAVLLTLLSVALIFGSKYAYTQSQLAQLTITTKTPGLVADVQSGDNAPLVEVLPTQQPAQIASGKIDLHISGDGQLSQRFEVQLPAGERKSVEVGLNDRRIGRQIPIDWAFRMLPFSDGVDPIVMTDKEIRRWDAERNTAVWTLDMQTTSRLLSSQEKQITWPWRENRVGFATGDKFDHQPYVLAQLNATDNIDRHHDRDTTGAPLDLDADGENDVVIAFREQAWVLAVSGRTGKVLWLAERGADIESPSSTSIQNRMLRSATLAPPLAAGDLNDDGTPDLIAMFGDIGDYNLRRAGPDVIPATRWMEAISGKTGEVLWRSDIEDDWLIPSEEDPTVEIPYAFRWFVGLRAGSMARGWGESRGPGPTGIVWRSRQREYMRSGQYSRIPDAPRLITWATTTRPQGHAIASDNNNSQQRLAFVSGTRVIQLDPRTGKLHSDPQDVGVLSGLPARYADMDGDGIDDVVLCEQRPDRTRNAVFGMVAQIPQFRIAVWSLAKNELLWQRDFTAHWPRKMEQDVAAPQWPLVSDLDGDGACELLIPDGTTNFKIHVPHPKAPRGELAVIDGATGEQKWKRGLFTLDQQLDHFLAGPDLDGDGTREVFVASLWGAQFDLFVDALSGTDGHTLWRSQHSLKHAEGPSNDHWISRLSWCSRGIDGWPQLAVSVHRGLYAKGSPNVYLVSSRSGELQHTAASAEVVWSGDVNRDGVEDLVSYVGPKQGIRRQGHVSLYHGLAAEYWRRLGDDRFPISDLDGDGIRDLLRQLDGKVLEASSGRSGDVLWKSKLDVTRLEHFEVLSQRGDAVAGLLSPDEQRRRDLDRDGTPDLLIGIHKQGSPAFAPLHAISGRTGKPLWSAGFQVTVCRGSPMIATRDLDGDGRSEVIYVGAMNLGYKQKNWQSSDEAQVWLIVLSAEDGRVQWKRPLSPAYGKTPQFNASRLRADLLRLQSPSVDLNGDGTLDLVLPAETNVEQAPVMNPAVELMAVSGADGSLLWQHDLPQLRQSPGSLLNVAPVIATDLDGDGGPEIVSLEFEDLAAASNKRIAHVRALEGATGQVRWEWQREIEATYGQIDDRHELDARPRPMVLRTKSGRPRIGIVLRSPFRTHPFEADILDHTGQPLSQMPLVAAEGWYMGDTHPLFSYDVDDDGDDELLFWNRQAVVAARADSNEIVWQRPLASRTHAQLVGLFQNPSATTLRPPVAVLRQGGGDNSLIGIDVATGQVRWKCAGPTTSGDGTWIVPERVELLGQMADAPPLAIFEYAAVSICRQAANATTWVRSNSAIAHEPSSELLANVPTALRTAAILSPHSADARIFRDLPWHIHLSDPDVSQMLRISKLSLLYCFTLILLPGAVFMSLIRRRKRDVWAIAALLTGCVSVFVGFTIGDAESETHMRVGRLVLALAPFPLIQFILGPLVQLVRGKWRRAGGWWIASIGISIALAAIVLAFHAASPDLGLQQTERYSFEGWYLIGLWGTYLTGVIMVVVAIGWPFVNRLRTYLFRPRETTLS